MNLPAPRPPSPVKQLAEWLTTPGKTFSNLWYRLYGHSIELPRQPSASVVELAPREYTFREISFTFALIALSARIACIDGALSRTRYAAFREAFPIERGICNKIRALFTLACEDQTPFTQYVRHIMFAYPRRIPLFAELVDRLFRIATADGTLSKPQEHILAKISHMLSLSPAQYSDIRTRHLHPRKPHEIMGVRKRTSAAVLRSRYFELMRRYHPDRYGAAALSPEVELLLQLKISEINDAYKHLSKRAA